MPYTALKNRQPISIRQSMEWSIENARKKHNRSVDRIADLMGVKSKWQIYKWMENGRLPSILIRPFEAACGIDFVTKYIAFSAHKIIIDIPRGKKATAKDINGLQVSLTQTIGELLKFYDGKSSSEETIASIQQSLEGLARQKGEVEKFAQPDFDFKGGK